MSTGISMSSVNKIKELADNGDYSLALDILEHQDLSKSLSPQFIRICGEVYYENGRYADARAALVRAHSMAPAGNKIIYSIIKLYLSMGFRKQAEHYFEIYRFNQESKDAGTYRIEYMIAKAYHKPVNELYSILVSANDVETSEEWDYEMLLLHAYIRNKDKFDSAAIEFKAKYRNSSRLSTLDSLIENTESLESKVYIFPCEDRNDDDPEQEEIREFEKKILDEDDLKIHPKDAKIMIMVEDDAPVTSSMKFKQMWVRSKDKKEHKKELRREETEEENKKDKKRSHGLWGIMSKKEEELVDKEMQDILSENMDKEKLLGEVVTSKAGELESAHVDEKTVSETSAVSKTESSEMKSGNDESGASQDMTEMSSYNISAEDSAVYNAEDEEGERALNGEPDEQEDLFVIEEEPEEVVMVDADLMTEESDEPEPEENDKTDSISEEAFDPEFSDEDDDLFFVAENDISVSEELQTENTSETDILESDMPEFDDLDSDEPGSDTSDEEITGIVENENFEPEKSDTDIKEPEEPEVSEVSDIEETESFDFDKALETLEKFEVDVNEDFEIDQKLDNIDDDDNDSESETSSMMEYGIDAEQEMVKDEPEVWEIEQGEESFEENPEAEFADEMAESEFEYEVDVDADIENEISVEETEPVSENEDYEIPSENIHEPSEEHQGDLEEPVREERSFRRYQSEKTRYAEFPVFKSSLFPDYNTDGAKLYEVGNGKNLKMGEQIETEEAKITENLQKEEDLIGETDRLLARLGIRFQTEFKSILDFGAEGDEDTGETDGENGPNAGGTRDARDSEDSDEKSEVDNIEKPFNEKIDKDSKKEKKYFKLKG